MTFESWMTQVDREIKKISGLTSEDLADQPFRDWFDDGVEPLDAAENTLGEEGFAFFVGRGQQ